MAILDPEDMAFERRYKAKFRAMAAPYGVAVEYEYDIATIDLGHHVTAFGQVTDSRVWFQFKGFYATTLSKEDFENAADVPYEKVKIEHLRAWYRAPEAVYLVFYIEAEDLFLAEDVRDIVRRQWGDELLNDATFKPGQETTTVRVSKTACVDDAFWRRLCQHSSMRTDGRKFRGRFLGHDLDPLRTTLRQMEPQLFDEIVRHLLSEHGYKREEVLDASPLFPGGEAAGNLASLECGVLHDMFEIVLQLFTEKIADEGGFRTEDPGDRVQGQCAVLIHSSVAVRPDIVGLRALANEQVRGRGIRRLLAFVNASLCGRVSCFGAYTEGLEKTGLCCWPQHLEDISFNFLTTTATYQRFRDRVSYFGGAGWKKEKGPLFILPPGGADAIPLK